MGIFTLYFRSDTHTVNGTTAYVIGNENSSSVLNIMATNGYTTRAATGNYEIVGVDILHSNSTTTNIAGTVANTWRYFQDGGDGYGVQSAIFSCPETSLVTTDALLIHWQCNVNGVYSAITDWVSNQLGWTKLQACDWTIYRYSRLYSGSQGGPYPGAWAQAYIYWGDASHTTYMGDISANDGSTGGYGLVI